jgi:hypothetical protein
VDSYIPKKKGVAGIVHGILDITPLVEFLQGRFTFPVCCPDGLADNASLFHEQKTSITVSTQTATCQDHARV